MRFIISEAEEAEVKTAMARLDVPGASVLLNPAWIPYDAKERLYVACGAPAVKMVQAAGWISKKGGVEANRGKLFEDVTPEGWDHPITVGVTYAPQIMHFDYAKFVTMQTDVAAFRRYEKTGSMEAQLGDYRYAPDLQGVVDYVTKQHAKTGEPVALALDTETEGLNPFDEAKQIVCIQASALEGISDVVYTKGLSEAKLKPIIEQLQWLAEQPWIKVVGANFKYDMLWLRVKWDVVFKNFTFDTCNGGSLLEENRPNTLNLHTKIYSPELGGYDDQFNASINKAKMGEVPKDILLPYAGGDTDACLRNYRKIREGIMADNVLPSGKQAKNSLASVYMHLVHPALSALHRMEHTGVLVDKEKFHELGADLENRMVEATRKAAQILPHWLIEKFGGLDQNGGAPLSKPFMIAEFLFSPMGLNIKPVQTTTTGKPSTSQYHLSQFADHPEAGPLIAHYLDYKSVAKMHGTYYVGFLKHLRPDDRWHASYIIHKQGKAKGQEQDAGGTVTGRGSAVDPAFQCVTGDTEILTPDGIRLAREIIDPMFADTSHNPFREYRGYVWGDGQWRQCSNVFRSWRADLMKIVLHNGNSITCTPEHPIMSRSGQWVKAKHLIEGDQIAMPKPFPRLECKASWATPEACEALGILAVVGYLDIKAPMVRIEVPWDYGQEIAAGWQSLGIAPKVDLLAEDRTYVITVEVKDGWTADQLNFLLALPEPGGEVVPRAIRATNRWYDYLRGIIKARGKFGPSKTRGKGMQAVSVHVPQKALARAIVRESLLEPFQPTKLYPLKNAFSLVYFGGHAKHVLQKCGLDHSQFDEYKPKSFNRASDLKSRGLQIASIELAGAGYVYDFHVPDTHDFVANGMLVHNTAPKHSYWGKRLRACMIAPPGYVIVARDYSQGELKVAACWAGEQKMIEAYRNNIDLHTLTAATTKGMSYEQAMMLKTTDTSAYALLRQNGKAGNFGLLYGMTAYGFMMYADAVFGLKLTLDEAEAMRNTFFELYPGLPLWHERQVMEAHQTGAVRSPLGRLRHLHNMNSPIKDVKKQSVNQAINSPIQATLVDMMWWSMGIIERERPQLLNAFGQIHDQGLWYSPEDEVDEALAYSGEIMENLPFEKTFGWRPELAFTTDAEVGYDLANLEKV